MVPVVVFPPATLPTNQLTVVLEEPVTVAVNCFGGSPARTLAELGETATVILGGGGGGGFEPEPEDVPPQRIWQTISKSVSSRVKRRMFYAELGTW